MNETAQRLWCRLFHKRHWHEQVYTDRVRYYQRTECWKCGAAHSAYRVCAEALLRTLGLWKEEA